MSNEALIYIKIIFLLGFTLHNIEEALWLPKWSKNAENFHKSVEPNQFIFAVIVVTIFGYIITGIDILFGYPDNFFNYLYLGFVGMMGMNAILPYFVVNHSFKAIYSRADYRIVFKSPFFLSFNLWIYPEGYKSLILDLINCFSKRCCTVIFEVCIQTRGTINKFYT